MPLKFPGHTRGCLHPGNGQSMPAKAILASAGERSGATYGKRTSLLCAVDLVDERVRPTRFLTSDNTYLSRPKTSRQVGRFAFHQAAWTDVPALVARYVRAAISENTRRAYAFDLRHFAEWGGHIPASDSLIARYLAEHAGTLATSTLARRLAAISKAHVTLGIPSPTKSELVRMTLRGIGRVHGKPPRRVAAAVKDDILVMVAGLGDSLKDQRDRALLLIGFAGAFRRSELVAINCSDLERVPQGVIVTVTRSKTDQAGKGRKVGIPYGCGAICPVKALNDWLEAANINQGPVFRSVSRHGHVSDKRLSPEAVALIVKARAAAAGLDPAKYAGHSLRAGLATSAAAVGVSSLKIREQTGHASDAMLRRYIRDGETFIDNAAGALL